MLEFSAILTAVKPKERSDQYHILAALYCLEAHIEPVTSAQVSELLALHIPKVKLPKNINSSLGAYTGLVDPIARASPKLWKLTPKGLDRLRELSGLPLATNPSEADFGVDVAFVCALEQPECDALIRANGGESNWTDVVDPRFPHVYRETQIKTDAGTTISAVCTTSTSMGLTAAAIATTQMVLRFHPRLVIMPGIAAGTRDGGKQFGDVLVADPSVDYSSGKIIERGGVQAFLPDAYPLGLHPRLRTVLQKYKKNHPLFDAIRAKWSGTVPPGRNRLHMGPLGAADQVIDNEQKIIEIQQFWRKLIGVEMESYAVYRACHEAPDPKPRYLSVKSLCDFAAEKNDGWQEYAAFVAAEFAIGFVRAEWDVMWPST